MWRTTDPREAIRALALGHLAALPTETVYGLGGRADDPHAVARIYATKGRPADHPLIAHVASATALDSWGRDVPDYARHLADAFWPGPMTLVVPRTSRAKDFITGGQDSVAIRVSSHPVMAAVITGLAVETADPHIAIAAPSANRFGRVSPTSAEHVVAELAGFLGAQDVVLDAGPCLVGVESSIIDCTGDHPRLLRPGAITAEQVSAVTGLPTSLDSTIRASGTLASHYAPTATVEIVEPDALQPGDATCGLLALAQVPTPSGVVRLSAPGTMEEYAAVLYRALREADALRLARVLVVLPPDTGIGTAIRDRISRAAHR
jgi:L-threonylcarbamoyladenylate synthase